MGKKIDAIVEIVAALLFFAPIILMFTAFFMLVEIQANTRFELEAMDICYMQETLEEKQACIESLENYKEEKEGRRKKDE